MRIWLIQTVVSPYRIELFRRLSTTPGVDFTLLLLSDRFLARPQWKRDLSTLPFRVQVPFSISHQPNPEKEFIINPFLLFTLLRGRPDVVICGGYNLATVSVWLYRLLTGARYVIWTEATLHTDGRIAGARLWLRRLLARGARAFIDAGTLARDYVRHLLPNLPESQLFRAFNCVDNELFAKTPAGANPPLSEKGFPPRNLLFVGALNERKGIPHLLEAYRLVSNRSPESIGLVLIGEGPCRPLAERYREQHSLAGLRLLGWLKNEETAPYYAQADIFMLLSAVDHNPLVLFEALAAGLPVISSHGVCNAIDFIEPGVNGFLVDPLNPEEVTARVLEILAWSPTQRETCRQRSQALVAKANYDDATAGFLAACRHALQPAPN